jgi:type I restriction enzyme S subunit
MEGVPQVALDEICTLQNGRAFKKAEWVSSGVPIIRIQNLNNPEAAFNYFDGDYDSRIAVHPGDLLFSWSGTVGSSFGPHIWERELGVLNQHIFKVNLNDKIDLRYAYHVLRFITAEIERNVHGAVGLVHISKSKLNKFQIPLPPLPEQERIVAILDEAFAAIATATANAEKNLANARELFESQLEESFQQLLDSSASEILSEVCSTITVGHVGSMVENYVDAGVPFLRSKNVRPFRISLDGLVFIDEEFHSTLKKSALSPGDLVIVRTGYPGTAAVIPQTLLRANCSDLVILRTGPRIDPDYLCLFFNSSFGRATVGGRLVGAAQKHFNVTEAKRTLVPIPSLEEQAALLEKATQQRNLTNQLEELTHRKIGLLTELKQSILQNAFTGELTADSGTTDRTLAEAGV